MYYLKFFSWFWNDHLNNVVEKAGFCLILWFAGLVITVIPGLLFNTPLIFGIYLIVSIACAILFSAAAGIVYMRKQYNEWQMQVINKLKGE
jgi:hypothetical protein